MLKIVVEVTKIIIQTFKHGNMILVTSAMIFNVKITIYIYF